MSLDRLSSKSIVSELVRVLGKSAVLSILEVTESRLNALTSGRGCLKDAQLQFISDRTGRSWMRWGVDAVGCSPKSAQERHLDRATYELLDKIDPVRIKPVKVSRRATIPLHRVSKIAPRQAI